MGSVRSSKRSNAARAVTPPTRGTPIPRMDFACTFAPRLINDAAPSQRIAVKKAEAASAALSRERRAAAPSPPPPMKRAKPGRRRRDATSPAVINERASTAAVQVFVFGGGESGELGLGPTQTTAPRPCKNPFLDPADAAALHVTDIACGGMHTVALTVDGRIVTWGVNDNKALGRDTAWHGGRLRDAAEEASGSDGAPPGLNPLESTPMAIDAAHFAAGTVFVSVAAGDSCSFALTSTGLVYGWGTFRDPDGKEAFGYAATTGALVAKQATPVLVPGLSRITQIACGANHALALDAAGDIWGWGCGQQLQFGRRLFGRHQDTLRPQVLRFCRGATAAIACGAYHCLARDTAGNVWGWGLNGCGQAGDDDEEALLARPAKIPALCGQRVTQLAGGAHHSAAVTADGACLVWGRLDGGQLGLAEQLAAGALLVRCDERGRPRICRVPTAVPLGEPVARVACGTDHTLFVARSGDVYATGFGSEGQLGLGSDEDAHTPQKIEGKQVSGQMLTWAGAGGQFSVVTGKAS